MANERITENIVRTHFKNDPLFIDKEIILDEQKSSIHSIKDLFSSASKSKTGMRGYPEFIISFNKAPEFIVVIECKADVNKHSSAKKNKPKDYAVDGILHYLKHINKKNNKLSIIGIAVSGMNDDELLVDHYYYNASNKETIHLPDNELLSLFSYLKLHDISEYADELSNLQIIQKAIEYNNILNKYSIPETERATFVSAVLIAIQYKPFRKSYHRYSSVTDLTEQLINACSKVLVQNDIDRNRSKIMINHYKTIKNHSITTQDTITDKKTKISLPNTLLIDFIKNIEKDIYPLLQYTHQGFDVLGIFYTEFIRYAGSDAKTGLVLTPYHVTTLFCDLVDLKVNDIVYDPCCGTGSFLIASMKRMIFLAGNNKSQIKNIKEKQLYGTEIRSDMFTHACSNMMMRGDGKSNIFNDDCFNNKHKKIIKSIKPTVVFLNPPYDVGADGQLNFINNAMEGLIVGGRCCAIVQMSAALVSSKEIIKQHNILLKKHTLVSVISMPNDLFHPGAVVVTCIMVFEAHRPHPVTHPVWFGYLKDDGFIKKKHQGRIDSGNWNPIKEELLKLFKHYDKPEFSVRKAVKANEEWCAEAYMETDYSKITKVDFINTVKKYVAFKVLDGEDYE